LNYRFLAGLYLLASFFCVFAQDIKNPTQKPGPAIVGQVVPMADGPIDNRFGNIVETESGLNRWVQTLTVPGAYFVKVYFEDYRLKKGDRLEIHDAYGNVKQTIYETGPGGKSDFWSLSIPGDTIWLEIFSENDYTKQYAFQMTKVFEGTTNVFGVQPISGIAPEPSPSNFKRSPCSDPQALDYRGVTCYEPGGQFEDANIWNNANATVGVLTIGQYGNGTWCSGSLVSSQNYIMTNQHCVEDLASCGTTEFVFNYFNEVCSVGLQPVGSITTQGYYCDNTNPDNFFFSPFNNNCDPVGLNNLDFTFASVLLNGPDPAPASVYPILEMEMDTDTIRNTTDMYIIGHPEGRPKMVSEGVMGFTSDFGLHYIAQTLGGNSGSPVFSRATHRMIGLHHCGGCSDPNVLNRGMFMSQIREVLDGLGDFFAPAPNLGFDNLIFSDANGDNDGAFDFGEIITVTGNILNAGNLASETGNLTITGVDGVQFQGNTTIAVGGLEPDQTSETFEFSFTLDQASFDCPSEFGVTLTVTYGDRTRSTSPTFSIGKPGDLTGTVTESMTDGPISIPDDNPTGISSTISISESGNILAPIEVSVDITHTYVGDLLVTLYAPDGTAVVLHSRTGGGDDNLMVTYGDGSNGTVIPASGGMTALASKEVNGDWRLEISDNANQDTGTLNDWSLNFGLGAFDCGSLPGMMIGSVNGSWGQTASVPVSYENSLDEYSFMVHFDPYMLSLSGINNHQTGPCAPSYQHVAPGIYQITGNCGDATTGGALLDLQFDVLGISGYAEVTASNMAHGLTGVTSVPGGVDLGDASNIDACSLPSLQFHSRWQSGVWFDAAVDGNSDGAVNMMDLVTRVNCPIVAKVSALR
jgi:subtilisin-like proprotein convertase family protein/V8-like Glu-specific endopeptidase